MVPMNGVVQYSHKSVVTPDTMAGDNDLIGFIDAPDIVPTNSTSRPMIPAIIIPPSFEIFLWTTT